MIFSTWAVPAAPPDPAVGPQHAPAALEVNWLAAPHLSFSKIDRPRIRHRALAPVHVPATALLPRYQQGRAMVADRDGPAAMATGLDDQAVMAIDREGRAVTTVVVPDDPATEMMVAQDAPVAMATDQDGPVIGLIAWAMAHGAITGPIESRTAVSGTIGATIAGARSTIIGTRTGTTTTIGTARVGGTDIRTADTTITIPASIVGAGPRGARCRRGSLGVGINRSTTTMAAMSTTLTTRFTTATDQ
jgi:hypothetical protein